MPEYKLPVWLYIRAITVSMHTLASPNETSKQDGGLPGGCITQQTTNPLAVLDAKCSTGPSSIPRCFINLLFAKKYVGSCTELPKPVLTIEAPMPRYKPLTPSLRNICRSPSKEFL